MGHRRRSSLLLVSTVAVLAALGLTFREAPAFAASQTLINDSFNQATTSSPVTGLNLDTPGFPCLTAGTDTTTTPIPGCGLQTPDAAGSGVMRLTDLGYSEASALLYTGTSVPTANGLDITFTQYQYGGDGADGIGFDLAAAPPAPTAVGEPGGALGYSPAGIAGLPAGYLGVGLDVYGNYSNYGGDNCDNNRADYGFYPNQVVVRGPGDGTDGYCLVTSSIDQSPDLLGESGPIQLQGSAGTRANAARGVQIQIDGTDQTVTVGIDPTGGTNYQTVAQGPLPDFYYDQSGAQHTGLPPRITFAISASTGAADDIHEISNLNVTTLAGTAPLLPVLGLTKTDNSGQKVAPGAGFDYTLTGSVQNTGGAEADPTTLHLTDPLPTGVTTTATPTGTDWNCSASTSTNVDCTYTGTTPVAAGATLPPVTVPAQLASTATNGANVANTATLVSDDATLPVTANDTITVTVAPPPALPESPALWLLPVAGLTIVGGAVLLRRRRAQRD